MQPVEFSFSLLKQNHGKKTDRVLIKHYFPREKSIKETEKSSQNIIISLLHRIAWFISASLNFFAAVLA